MTNTLLKPLNRFDIKILIFLQCRTCFRQNKEKDVAKRCQRYTCLTSHNFLTSKPISKILFVFSFNYIALSNLCIRYQFRPEKKNSFALLHKTKLLMSSIVPHQLKLLVRHAAATKIIVYTPANYCDSEILFETASGQLGT